jgi:hypothetical protein
MNHYCPGHAISFIYFMCVLWLVGLLVIFLPSSVPYLTRAASAFSGLCTCYIVASSVPWFLFRSRIRDMDCIFPVIIGSPSDQIILQQANRTLNYIVAAGSPLNSPTRTYIHRMTRAAEAYQAELAIGKKETI